MKETMSSFMFLFAAFASRQVRCFTYHSSLLSTQIYNSQQSLPISSSIFLNSLPTSTSTISSTAATATKATTTRASLFAFATRRLVSLGNGNLNIIESGGDEITERRSVTGIIYTSKLTQEEIDNQDYSKEPLVVQLFTKEGCTLCDKVKEVLQSIQSIHSHTLQAIDITDPDKTIYYDKYKYDIPILHINGEYWTKHRLSKEEAIETIESLIPMKENEGKLGFMKPNTGEPDAGEMERKQMERMKDEK